jgi:hypothetical protein
MSQLNVNVVAPLGYTGPDLTGDSNFVEIIDKNGNTAMEITETETTVVGPLKVDSVIPNTGTVVDVNGVEISSPGSNETRIGAGTTQIIGAGADNTAIGANALGGNQDAGGNVAIGVNSMFWGDTFTPGFASDNVAIGNDSLLQCGFGVGNVGIGKGVMPLNISMNYNTAVGFVSGPLFFDGINNLFLGNQSGPAFANGTNNIFIGSYAGGTNGGPSTKYQEVGTNNILIGYDSRPAANNANNVITLGNSGHNTLRCAVTSITSLSDERDKKEIKDLSTGLEFVESLRPVEFVWNDRDEYGKHDIADFGFIAQDLKKAQEDVDKADVLKLVYEENPEKLEASYGKLVPILVKAIQELSEEVKQLKTK